MRILSSKMSQVAGMSEEAKRAMGLSEVAANQGFSESE